MKEETALFHGDLVNSTRKLYTPSEFARLSLFHIQEIGTLQATKPHMSKRENLNSYLFFIVHSGSGMLSYDGISYPISPGDCVFIDCKKPYYHETSEDLWNLSWVHFNGPTAANIYQKYRERGGLPAFHPQNVQSYTAAFHALYEIAFGNSFTRDMEINEKIARILTLLMEDSWHPDQNRNDTKKTNLLAIKHYLDAHFSEKIALDDLAERFYINKYYLTRIFKEQFGSSISSYLLSVRITHAKQELRFTDNSAEQIGNECGIGDLYYFSRVFKKVEGCTISEYRRMWGR